jgi:hypothetical protein
MASFFNKVKAALSIGNANSWSNPNAKTKPQPKPQPKVNVAQLQRAMQGPGFQSYNNVAHPAPRPQPAPPAQGHQNIFNRDFSEGLNNLVVGTAQSVPRGLVRADRSLMPGPHQNFTPTTKGQKIILGNQPIQTYGKENKQHGSGLTGALAVAGSILADVPGIPGKKQIAGEAGKVAKGIKVSKKVNKPNVPEVVHPVYGSLKDFKNKYSVGIGDVSRLKHNADGTEFWGKDQQLSKVVSSNKGIYSTEALYNHLTQPTKGAKSLEKAPQIAKVSKTSPKISPKSVIPRTSPTSSVPRSGAAAQSLPTSVSESGKLTKPPQIKAIQNQESQLPSVSPSSINNTVRQRGFTTSVKSSSQVSPTVQQGVGGTYKVRNTAQMAATAEKRATNLGRATKQVNEHLSVKTGTIPDQHIADAIAVAKAHDAKGNFDQAQHIYDRLAEHGTKGGQQIQAFSLLKNRTPDGMRFQAARALKKAGIELDEAGHKELQSLVENVKKTKIGTPERDMAIHQMVKYVNDRIPSSLGDKAVNFWRAGLLSSPITTGGNILGNTTEALTRNLFTNPVAAAADKAMSLITGKRTKTLAGGQTQGVKTGLKKAKVYLKTGFDERRPEQKFDAKQVNYNNKAINTYVNGIYKWMGGQDQPFYYAAREQAARDLAKADAKNLKLKGTEAKAYVDQAASNPDWKPQTFKTSHDAMTAGKYSVFQNETALANSASEAAKHLGPLGTFILPFKQVPASIAMRILDRTPIGTAREMIGQAINVSKGGAFDQRAMAEAIGNGAFAPGVLAAGYALSRTGEITGNYPLDPKEQELWKLEGKQPNSLKVGGRWYSLNYMQPFGTLLGIGAQVQDDVKNGKSAGEAWASAGGTAAKSVESQSFLQGLNGLLSAINDPQRSMNKYVTTASSSLVPNFIRTGARAFDPLQREAKGAVQGLESAVPGLRQKLPAKQDAFGQDLKRPDNALNQLANPLRPSKIKGSDSVVNELQRLQDTKNGIIPTQYSKTTFSGTKLSDTQVRDLQKRLGDALKPDWNNIINDPRYKSLSDEEKNTKLKSQMDIVSEAVKRQFAVDNNIPLNKPASKKVQDYLTGNGPDVLAAKKSSTKIPSMTETKYDATSGTWTQTNKATGKVTLIASDGTRTVAKKGLGTIKNARPDYVTAIHTSASKQNLDIPAVMAVAAAEGLGGGVGDGGTSFGPFQLHVGGALPPGKDQAWAESPAGIDYAVQQIAKVAKGKSGQDAIAAIVNSFERPADPNGEIQKALAIYNGSSATLASGAPRGATVKVSSGSRSSGVKAAKAATVKMGRLPSSKVSVKLSRVKVPKSRSVKVKLPKVGKAKRVKVKA